MREREEKKQLNEISSGLTLPGPGVRPHLLIALRADGPNEQPKQAHESGGASGSGNLWEWLS